MKSVTLKNLYDYSALIVRKVKGFEKILRS